MRGFALIELLIVVLIIGILSAVVLPQYQMAVEKARVAEAIVVLRAIAQAHEVYFMANGEYTHDLTQLDIVIPGENASWDSMARKSSKYFQYGTRATSITNISGPIALAQRLPFNTLYYLFINSGENRVFCKPINNNNYGTKVCRFLSNGKKEGAAYIVE